MNNISQRQQGIFLLVLGTIFWSLTYVFIKGSVETLNITSFLFFRFAIAAVSLAIIFYKRLSKINKNVIYKGFLLSIPLTIGFVTQTIGVKHTTASNAGFISGLIVVVVPLIVSLVERKWPKKATVIAVVLSTSGLAFITINESLIFNKGDLWVFACVFAFAAYMYMVSRESGKHDSILLTLVQLIIVSIFTFILGISSEGITMPVSYNEWEGIIFCALFATTFTYTVQNHYQQFFTATSTAIIFSFEPLFAAIAAFIFLHEEITFRIVVGGILILSGMLICELYDVLILKIKLFLRVYKLKESES